MMNVSLDFPACNARRRHGDKWRPRQVEVKILYQSAWNSTGAKN